MRKILILLFLVLTFTSWKADTSGPWIITKGSKIIIYSRPIGYSRSESPDSSAVQSIIREQERVIDYINQRLKTTFDSRVKIFLYNKDEAKEKIGTGGGGFASLCRSERHIYFTFHSKPFFNTVLDQYDYLGAHEMVHIITINQLGKLRTRFFGEGYANAIDGNYSVEEVSGIWRRKRNDSTITQIAGKGRLLSPSELLYSDSVPESEYYPQIGCLISWLFEKYGIDKINQLYDFRRDKIEKAFQRVTGDTFRDMELAYMKHLKEQGFDLSAKRL